MIASGQNNGSSWPCAEDRTWARDILRVPADASKEQELALALTRLQEAEFVPSSEWEWAILLLAADPVQEICSCRPNEAMIHSREVAMTAEVDDFAEEYFTLAVAERHTRWRMLMERCAFSLPLTVRLEALVDGLDVVPPCEEPGHNSRIAELVRELCKVFVLAPSERAAHHDDILRRAAVHPRTWQSTARELLKRYPQVVPLASTLIDTLSNYVRVRKAEKKTIAKKRAAVARAAKQTAPHISVWVWGVLAGAIATLGRLGTLSHEPPTRYVAPHRGPAPVQTWKVQVNQPQSSHGYNVHVPLPGLPPFDDETSEAKRTNPPKVKPIHRSQPSRDDDSLAPLPGLPPSDDETSEGQETDPPKVKPSHRLQPSRDDDSLAPLPGLPPSDDQAADARKNDYEQP